MDHMGKIADALRKVQRSPMPVGFGLFEALDFSTLWHRREVI
jgi:hypothetical protein